VSVAARITAGGREGPPVGRLSALGGEGGAARHTRCCVNPSRGLSGAQAISFAERSAWWRSGPPSPRFRGGVGPLPALS
jgi:hypothetical protein